MTGTEEDAHHAPQKTTDGCQGKAAGYPGIDGQEESVKHGYFSASSLSRISLMDFLSKNPKCLKVSLPVLSKNIWVGIP